jgi:hypothetical protein
MSTRTLIRMIGVTLAVCLAAGAALADEGGWPRFFVDEAGIARVPQDYATIQDAIDGVEDGATILVTAGVYQENLLVDGKSVLVQSESGPSRTEVRAAASRPVAEVRGAGVRFMLDGFTLRRGHAADGAGLRIRDADVVLANNRILENTASEGAAVRIAEATCLLVHNDVAENVGGGVHLIGGRPYLYENLIRENTGPGLLLERTERGLVAGNVIELTGGAGFASGGARALILADNVVSSSGAEGIRLDAGSAAVINNLVTGSALSALLLDGGVIADVINNTLAGSGGHGIEALNCDALLRNNILVENDGFGLLVSPFAPVDGDYDLLWNNAMGEYGGAAAAGANDLSQDPLFVEGIWGSHYLSCRSAGDPAESPARNAGPGSGAEYCFPTDSGVPWTQFLVDESSVFRAELCLNRLTTRRDGLADQGAVDLGYHYHGQSGEATPTPLPEPTATATPEPTTTPLPDRFTVNLLLNKLEFHPGDLFDLLLQAYNPGPALMADHYVILDAFGEYYIWPSWTTYPPNIDFRTAQVETGLNNTSILRFIWPQTQGSADGLVFWAALCRSGTFEILGEVNMVVWGFGP